MKIVRSVLGVVFGFTVFFAIIHLMNTAWGNNLLITLTWTVAASVIGGYIAARIPGNHEFPHAAAVGLLMIALSFLNMRGVGASRPGPYEIAVAGCGPISAMIGAAIRLLTKPRSRIPPVRPVADSR